MMKKFEQFRKKCNEWIFFEGELSYSDPSTYIRKCRPANILSSGSSDPQQVQKSMKDATHRVSPFQYHVCCVGCF